jgi:ABC-2 type transport system ATP-binding protein
MLEVKNLVKAFQNTVAVNNISFIIQPGKIFGLLGPNGAGKTTTIRTILNIIKPTSGSIFFDGQVLTEEFLNKIGYLPEERGLYKKSKVSDVLQYFARLKNMPPALATEQIEIWLKKLNILKYRYNKIEELSKGNQQKIQFIMSVIHNPELIIFDEPFTGFDPINQQEIRELIFSFISEGKIIILSTHQMETAEKLCSEIFLINNGKEIKSGSLEEIKKDFGGNNVEIKFSGNISAISDMKEIYSIDTYNNYAEIQLGQDISPSLFLKKITDKIDISHFSVIEPTLNKVFIDLIKHEQN